MTTKTSDGVKSELPGLPTIEQVAASLAQKHTAPPTEVSEEAPTEVPSEAPVEVATEAEEVLEGTPTPKEEEIKVKRDNATGRFAALSRRDKEIRERERQAEARLKEVEERAKKIEERERVLASAKRPSELLKAHGFTYADATQDVLGQFKEPEADPVDTKLSEKLSPIEQKFAEMEKKIERYEKIVEQYEQDKYATAMQTVRTEIKRTADEGGFELIGAMGDEAVSLVQDVMTNYWDKHKKVLQYSDACAMVEKYYEDRVSKLTATSKVKSKFAPTSAVPEAIPTKKEVKSSNTLTQSHSTATKVKPDINSMSKNEAIAHLATTLKFK